jgi:hypothetical protein
MALVEENSTTKNSHGYSKLYFTTIIFIMDVYCFTTVSSKKKKKKEQKQYKTKTIKDQKQYRAKK